MLPDGTLSTSAYTVGASEGGLWWLWAYINLSNEDREYCGIYVDGAYSSEWYAGFIGGSVVASQVDSIGTLAYLTPGQVADVRTKHQTGVAATLSLVRFGGICLERV